jgi:hypothetical protein
MIKFNVDSLVSSFAFSLQQYNFDRHFWYKKISKGGRGGSEGPRVRGARRGLPLQPNRMLQLSADRVRVPLGPYLRGCRNKTRAAAAFFAANYLIFQIQTL